MGESMNKFLGAIVGIITKAGKTPAGKAIEHAAVAGASVGISLLLAAVMSGGLSLTALGAAAVAAGSATLAGLRAALKAKLG
jgi:hypothetical protein